MASGTQQKKRLVVSYKNLTPELLDEVKRQYPMGYVDHMIRIEKGPGSFFYAIVLETSEISYLIKVDVKVDDNPEEEDEKDYYNDDLKGADELSESEEEEE